MSETANSTLPPDPEALAPDREKGFAFFSDWKLEPQSNDRVPMFGVVSSRQASEAARRSSTRRQRKATYKEWSRQRHD